MSIYLIKRIKSGFSTSTIVKIYWSGNLTQIMSFSVLEKWRHRSLRKSGRCQSKIGISTESILHHFWRQDAGLLNLSKEIANTNYLKIKLFTWLTNKHMHVQMLLFEYVYLWTVMTNWFEVVFLGGGQIYVLEKHEIEQQDCIRHQASGSYF